MWTLVPFYLTAVRVLVLYAQTPQSLSVTSSYNNLTIRPSLGKRQCEKRKGAYLQETLQPVLRVRGMQPVRAPVGQKGQEACIDGAHKYHGHQKGQGSFDWR